MIISITTSPEETLAFGASLVHTFPEGGCFLLSGDLGAGKTTLVKGIVSTVTGISPEQVTSPTFAYLNIYEGEKSTCFHFDVYRLETSDEFIALGLSEYLTMPGFVCIEWSERISSLLPPSCYRIILKWLDAHRRQIEVIPCV